MRSTTTRIAGALASATLLCTLTTSTMAQWSDDPMVNLAIGDRPGSQATPILAPTPDGGCWIGWWDNASGNFSMYVQKLDDAGNEQFPHNGLLVSDNPQQSALFGWDMIADASGHCVIVLSDARDGGDLDIHAYRIAPDGTQVWGADGVTLSDNPDFEPAPKVAETSSGEFVFVWSRLPDGADGELLMARLDSAGSAVFPTTTIVAVPGESPGFADVVASEAGTVIVSWLRDISSFISPRHIRAQKFSTLALPVWIAGPTEVFDAAGVPIGYTPILAPDGDGGAVLCWHRSANNLFSSFVQRLDSDGVEMFPHNGVEVSTTPNRFHIDPALAFDEDAGDSYVFWNERNPNQDMWGVFGQKISATGARQWTDGGIEYEPLDSVNQSLPTAVATGDGAIAFWFDQPGGPSGADRIVGRRVDDAGVSIWSAIASNAPSDKLRLSMSLGATGAALMAWVDDRNGDNDIYAQNVNADGSLGAAACPADLDGDGAVGSADLAILLGSWGAADNAADLDDSGTVGSGDLAILLGSWGPCD